MNRVDIVRSIFIQMEECERRITFYEQEIAEDEAELRCYIEELESLQKMFSEAVNHNTELNVLEGKLNADQN
jgi:hypothetical protein